MIFDSSDALLFLRYARSIIKIMCPSGATCLPTDCCFRQIVL